MILPVKHFAMLLATKICEVSHNYYERHAGDAKRRLSSGYTKQLAFYALSQYPGAKYKRDGAL